MGELSIRRNRMTTVPKYQGTAKTEKQAAAGQTQRAASGRAADSVSETLRQLMSRVDQAGRQTREGRRALQSGEAALAEVEDNLGRMEELAQEAAGDGPVDRDALQQSLERLRGEISRIAQAGIKAGMFQDGDGLDGLDALVDAVMDGLSARQTGTGSLPAWLLGGMTGDAPDGDDLLYALGLDHSASGADVLAALGNLGLEDSAAVGYLAAYYLGAVIAGGVPDGAIDPSLAAQGLQLLLEAVADGASPDQALELLTGGLFTSLEEFQAQFTGGTAPGLEVFLTDLLFSQEGVQMDTSLLDLMAGGGSLDMLMDLMAALDGSGDGLMALLDGLGAADGAGVSVRLETMELGGVQVSGQDLSGVSFDAERSVLTVDGSADVTLRGLGQEAPEIRLVGSGTVTLQQVSVPLLSAEGELVQVVGAGENTLAQVQLADGTVLTVDGGGLVQIGGLSGGQGGVLRLAGGVTVLGRDGRAMTALTPEELGQAASVVVDGPAVLLAAQGVAVQNAQGEPLTPFDMIWKTLIPEWSSLTSLMVDGKQGQLLLRADGQMDPARLWLLKGNEDKGWPAHTIVLRGRDRAGRPTTRYVYVRWDERKGSFQQVPMYPNPFNVTGGEQDTDWRYEEESQTLWILSGEAVTISGGAGTDANLMPFSGRIAVADGIGAASLTLDGVVCRVPFGRAFYMGCRNDVTLLLPSGTENVFESGEGFAGISLGDYTSLHIDRVKGAKGEPDGTLTAKGGERGAGIGRDSGAGQERTGTIQIRGGAITATGTGGGAGIGGAVGAAVGDIRIQGGMVTAYADSCAAAIGAGIQGACGDIAITGSAKVAKAQGGGPDGDIGGCLFGNCGKVQVDPGLNLGSAKLWTQRGLSLQVGESNVTLPRFRVTARALRLDGLDVTTRQAARTTLEILTTDRRWVTRLQGAYGAMYGQLAQSFGGMYNVHRQFSVVRDTSEASSLVMDIREVLRQSPRAKFLAQRGMEDVGLLLR